MNWHSISESVIQIAETLMLALFAVEVVSRTAILTITEIRRAWSVMGRDVSRDDKPDTTSPPSPPSPQVQVA